MKIVFARAAARPTVGVEWMAVHGGVADFRIHASNSGSVAASMISWLAAMVRVSIVGFGTGR